MGAQGGIGVLRAGVCCGTKPQRWMISLLILNATRLFPPGKRGREGSAWGSPKVLPVFIASAAGKWKILQPGGEATQGSCQQWQQKQTPCSIFRSGCCSPPGCLGTGAGCILPSQVLSPACQVCRDSYPQGKQLTFEFPVDYKDNHC